MSKAASTLLVTIEKYERMHSAPDGEDTRAPPWRAAETLAVEIAISPAATDEELAVNGA